MTAELILEALKILNTYGPAAYGAVVGLIHNDNPTKADWLALLDHATEKKFDDYVALARVRAGLPPLAP